MVQQTQKFLSSETEMLARRSIRSIPVLGKKTWEEKWLSVEKKIELETWRSRSHINIF